MILIPSPSERRSQDRVATKPRPMLRHWSVRVGRSAVISLWKRMPDTFHQKRWGLRAGRALSIRTWGFPRSHRSMRRSNCQTRCGGAAMKSSSLTSMRHEGRLIRPQLTKNDISLVGSATRGLFRLCGDQQGHKRGIREAHQPKQNHRDRKRIHRYFSAPAAFVSIGKTDCPLYFGVRRPLLTFGGYAKCSSASYLPLLFYFLPTRHMPKVRASKSAQRCRIGST